MSNCRLATVVLGAGLFAPALLAVEGTQTEDEKTLYSIGQRIGQVLEPVRMSPGEVEWVRFGMNDVLSGNDTGGVDPADFQSDHQTLWDTRSQQSEAATTETAEDRDMFYAIGMYQAGGMVEFDLSASEIEWVLAGLTDSLLGKVARGIDAASFEQQMRDFVARRNSRQAAAEREAAAPFLAAAAAEPGAWTTASGMIYSVIEEGTGEAVSVGDGVTINYTGTLRDGTVFGRSPEGEPATFALSALPDCLSEGLLLMRVRGRSKMVCPGLAYGDTPQVPDGKPGAPIIFEVELVGRPRWVDLRDGTMKDTTAKLVWLRTDDCFSEMSWDDAGGAARSVSAGSCGLDEGYMWDGWRLPSNEDWETIQQDACAPTVDAAVPALPEVWDVSQVIPDQVLAKSYWSSTEGGESHPAYSWVANNFHCTMHLAERLFRFRVWPVRPESEPPR